MPAEEIKRLREEQDRQWLDAITTIFGMLPLLGDVFFKPMAVTIMFGLGFATLLRLIVIPVSFALFYHFEDA